MILRAVAVGLISSALSIALAGCVKNATPVSPLEVVVGSVQANRLDVSTTSDREAHHTLWDSKDEVDVEWRGRWWPAIVLERKNETRYLVHYDGWGEEWDEVVPPERIRLRTVSPVEDNGEPLETDADP